MAAPQMRGKTVKFQTETLSDNFAANKQDSNGCGFRGTFCRRSEESVWRSIVRYKVLVAAVATCLSVSSAVGQQAPTTTPAEPSPPSQSSVAAPESPPGFERVSFFSKGGNGTTITGYLKRPAGSGPTAAVIALHGCGGLFTGKGAMQKREVDWADRLTAAGYAVLFPDSFNPRGYRQICTVKGADRPIRPQARALDAQAALAFLAAQPGIDPARIALMGWSNGGSTVLWTVGRDAASTASKVPAFRAAIAFYPGCRPMAERENWAPHVPLTILMGDADDWTPIAPCRVLAAKHNVPLVAYPGAYHGFDAPDTPVHVRTGIGLSANGDGRVHVGTNPEARAAAIQEVDRILKAALP